MNKKNILLVGVSGVGKSSLINCFIPNAAKTFEGDQYTQSLSRTTTDISYYDYNFENQECILIDTPGVFDHVLQSFDKSCLHLENILKEVDYIDYVWFCISATKDKIREIDIEAKKVLNKFPHLLSRTSVIITKCDLLDQISMPNFINTYRRSSVGNDTSGIYTLPTYLHAAMNKEHKLLQIIKKTTNTNIINNYVRTETDKLNNYVRTETGNINYYKSLVHTEWFNNYNDKNGQYKTLFNDINKVERSDIKEYYSVENNITIPIIQQIQQQFYDKNLYSNEYLNYCNKQNDNSFIGPIVAIVCVIMTFCSHKGMCHADTFIFTVTAALLTGILCLIHRLIYNNKYIFVKTITYKHYNTKNIKLKLLVLNEKGNNNILIQDKIYYESGNIFYEGTLYGNTFNLGKFYNDDGTLLYHKKL